MYTVTYYKLGTRWFLDFPEYLEKGGSEEDLEPIGGFVDLLEMASQGNSVVFLQIDSKPFAGANNARLVGSSGGDTGAYYLVNNVDGKPAEIELWVNKTIYSLFNQLPESIYFKNVVTD